MIRRKSRFGNVASIDAKRTRAERRKSRNREARSVQKNYLTGKSMGEDGTGASIIFRAKRRAERYAARVNR